MIFLSFIVIFIIIGSIIYTYKKKAYISQTLIIANFLIFIIMVMVTVIANQDLNDSDNYYDDTIRDLGFKSNYFKSLDKIWTVFTSLYIHAGVLHVMMNMIFLLFLGLPLEEKIGTKKFAIIYFSTGILADVVNGIINISLNNGTTFNPEIIGIGASGAIFGIMGGFVILYPREKIIMPLGFILMTHPIPVIFAVMIFGGLETFYVISSAQDNIGHIVHVAGLISGVLIAPLIVKEKSEKKIMDFEIIEKLGADQKDVLERIRNEDTNEIRDAWIEYLLKHAKCPKCGKGMEVKNQNAICNCGYKIGLMKKI